MNREIKFRAWNKETDKMIFPDDNDCYFEITDAGLNLLDLTKEPNHLGSSYYDSVLMQYTGLKDMNGVEIYEGDIVKNIRNGISRKVYWDTHCASFHLSKRGREKPSVEYWSLSNPKWNYEVIGNIYENPELLKEE